MTSNELFERCLKVSPGGVHSPVRAFKSVGGTPVFFKKAKGAYLESVDGKEYVDFCQSFGPLLLGHRDPEVQDEVLSMVDTAWSFGACEPYSLELAEWMCQEIPWLDKVRFVSSGTEAVMSAIRLARAATGRNKVLKFEGCYHGHYDPMLVKAGSGLAGQSASDSAGVSDKGASETLVAPLDDDTYLEKVFEEHGRDIATVIVEPLPANFGMLVQRQEFLEKIQSLCKAHGALLIFDEVISGFRVALGGMAEMTGMTPDLVCYGKIIGGGFPVGCYGGRHELMDMVAPNGPVYQAGTLSGNPIGMRAGLTTLKKAKRENLWQVLGERTEKFSNQIQDLFRTEDINMKVVRRPTLMWMHSADEAEPHHLEQIPKNHGEKFKGLFHACLEQGLYFAPSAFEVSFLSWAHTDEVLDSSLEKLATAISSYKKGSV